MNVLRELRKFKTKSAMAKIRVLIILAVMLVASTYAWWSLQRDVTVKGIVGNVEAWDVDYYFDGDKYENEVTIAIDEFYPGAYLSGNPFKKTIYIKNKAESETTIKYEVEKVELFGIDRTAESGIYNHDTTNKKIDFFTNKDEYPFYMKCTYDKTQISGEYDEDSGGPSSAIAKMDFEAYWDYETGKDDKDTELGKEAYSYYNANADKEYALLITVKITSNKNESPET